MIHFFNIRLERWPVTFPRNDFDISHIIFLFVFVFILGICSAKNFLPIFTIFIAIAVTALLIGLLIVIIYDFHAGWLDEFAPL